MIGPRPANAAVYVSKEKLKIEAEEKKLLKAEETEKQLIKKDEEKLAKLEEQTMTETFGIPQVYDAEKKLRAEEKKLREQVKEQDAKVKELIKEDLAIKL